MVIKEQHLPANINQHIARIRIDTRRCRPEFLSEWLNSPTGNALINSAASGGTRPALSYKAIRNLFIPLPSDLSVQDKLIGKMKVARSERSSKLIEAEAVLANMDDFVLNSLGIAPPSGDERRVFAVHPSQVGAQERLDADYYHPERIRALSTINKLSRSLEVKRLNEVVSFERVKLNSPRENYLSLAHVKSNTGELTDTSGTASGSCFAFKTDDVLFARLRPYLNKVYKAEMDGCCSMEFHVLRCLDHQVLLPEYLATILRSRIVLGQTIHMMTGNTHPRLSNYDVENILIPVPSLEVQNAISAEMNRCRHQSQKLRMSAETNWSVAKVQFEALLLEG